MQTFGKSSDQIRSEFINFFQSKGHTALPSASLVPNNDPSLLFTNAGMNQFKDVFLNQGERPYKRAVDTQKVMRVSGKHNDFDDVGRDTYHHTFFEMLGNWSFGDYYKKEAIMWAWELLSNVWKLPKERLYATVHESDSESLSIWQEETDIDPSHILTFGDKDNFWEMGVTGPCGPCSEIHIDLTPDLSQSIGKTGINAENPLFIELWNLVFIQYKRLEDQTLEPLPKKHVDTGMGFERIVTVLQGHRSNYDSDLFIPIIDKISKDSQVAYDPGLMGTPHRVIADHIRALVFSIADGVIPSSEGRGYVIRKILRRAIRFGKELGYMQPFLYKLVDIVVEMMSKTFPEIHEQKDSIKSIIENEEISFFKTVNIGFEKIKEIIRVAKDTKKTQISGDEVFLLFDSMGFPVDFTEQILKDENLSFDTDRFNFLMEQQKQRARTSSSQKKETVLLFNNFPKTHFLGYEQTQNTAKILAISDGSQLISKASLGDEVIILLDASPFYGEKGGQIGDSGYIKSNDASLEVTDTKIINDRYLHFGKIIKGSFTKNDSVYAEVNIARQKNIARHHSTAHLLFMALRSVLGNHITQAGSWVGEDRVRIDFTHPKPLSEKELAHIETIVIDSILENSHTVIEEMSLSQAKSMGAVATFEEKYGDFVRVVRLGDSYELCGGLHVANTGEIGLTFITKECSVSSGLRRLEAVSGYSAYACAKNCQQLNHKIADTLKCTSSEISVKLDNTLLDLKEKDFRIKHWEKEFLARTFEAILTDALKIGAIQVLTGNVDGDKSTLQGMMKFFKDRVKNGIFILGITKSTKEGSLAVFTSGEMCKLFPANSLLAKLLPIIKGKGGGKSGQAVAGTDYPKSLEMALLEARKIIIKQCSYN